MNQIVVKLSSDDRGRTKRKWRDGKDECVYFVLFNYLLFRCLGQLRTLYTYA